MMSEYLSVAKTTFVSQRSLCLSLRGFQNEVLRGHQRSYKSSHYFFR